MVLTYLRTNTKVNETIKAFFPKLTSKKSKYVDFNLSTRIDFMSISYFNEKLKNSDIILEPELLENPKLYHKKYYFDSYESTFLSKIAQSNDSKLYLTFSKPIEDHLIVELGNFYPALNSKVKYGKELAMLFKFDSSGLVREVLFAGSAYN